MNAPFALARGEVRSLDLRDPGEVARIERFVARHEAATPFHRPAWFLAVAAATGNSAHALVQEHDGEIAALLPLDAVHSPIFGRLLVSTAFAVGGGILSSGRGEPALLIEAAQELAQRLSCATLELRGGVLPDSADGWTIRSQSHCTFRRALAADADAELLAIPRKQRAEVRKALAEDLAVEVGSRERDRAAHYRVLGESYRNLGTPVFPRSLFDAVLDAFGSDADILTVRHRDKPVASVLSLYHGGVVMPYWGGGTFAARRLRANDRMYFELMGHARARGCTTFDFGRSKTGSGAFHFKRNWGFEPETVRYAVHTAPGETARDADPAGAGMARKIALWQRLPLPVANRLGPLIARGIG